MAGGAEAALAVEQHVAPHQAPEVVAGVAGGEGGRGEPVATILQARQALGVAAQVAVMEDVVGLVDAGGIADQRELAGVAAHQQAPVTQRHGPLGEDALAAGRHPHLGGLELGVVTAQHHLAAQQGLAILAVAGAPGLAGDLAGLGGRQAIGGHHVAAAAQRIRRPLAAPGLEVEALGGKGLGGRRQQRSAGERGGRQACQGHP